MNKNPIDIVVPWVNPNDGVWKKDFEYWKEKESGQKDSCRFRDLGVFNFWFRCIEKNMPWVRYVFLLLASPSQIPNWLNTNNPKLKIVYHNQFIPVEELPTFNSSVINCYVPYIKDLSDNYILFNDDFFVMKTLKDSDYFINDVPCGVFKISSGMPSGNAPWYHNIRNNSTIVKKYFGVSRHILPEHGPIAFSKNFQLFILYKFGKEIKSALHNSKFRQNKNVTDWIYYDIAAITNKMKKNDNRKISFQYVNKPNFNEIKQIVCFNDNETLNNTQFQEFKTRIYNYLNKQLPKKCSYEK